MAPRLSVVIASVTGLPSILECLEKLEALAEREQMEILVLDRRTDGTAQAIGKQFPRVSLTAGLTGKSIPELRWMGMRAAKGEMVAVLEDHCMVTPRWAAEILRFIDSPYGVVGGPVENGAQERVLDRVFFLAEYGALMPPLPEGETNSVAGNNAAYRRSVLPLDEPVWAERWESFLHAELRRRGVRMWLNPAMLVYHKKSFRLGEMLEQRYLYSRSFAAMRAASMSLPGRFVYAVLSVLLPPLLLLRTIRSAARVSKFGHLVPAWPVMALFVTAWAAGEMAGYLAGPGDSLARVE